jgi:membrane fusion protein, multidrug efflux system
MNQSSTQATTDGALKIRWPPDEDDMANAAEFAAQQWRISETIKDRAAAQRNATTPKVRLNQCLTWSIGWKAISRARLAGLAVRFESSLFLLPTAVIIMACPEHAGSARRFRLLHPTTTGSPDCDGGSAAIALACCALLPMLVAVLVTVTPAAAQPRAVEAPVLVQPATQRVLQATTVGFGTVQSRPADVVSVTAPHAGIINEVYVRPGETVSQGKPVAELAVAAATQEAYRKAKIAADYAKAKLERMRYLWSKRIITRDALDQAEIAYKNAEAALQAEKQIGAQRPAMTIPAPISGTVTAVSVSEGDRIQQEAKILAMAPSAARAVLLGIEPEDIGKIRVGMPVKLAPAFEPSERFAGKVAGINATIDPKTRLVDVIVDLDPNAAAQPIGAYMRGEIILDRVRALAVPREAILYDKNGAYVFVVKGETARRVTVTTVAEGDGNVAIAGAIKAGDRVVVQGNYELSDGMHVREVARAVH